MADTTAAKLTAALASAKESTRLKAALAIGTDPDPALIDTLIARCAVEPAFFVRDMLTWALNRFPPALTVPKLLVELRSDKAQARSQALHTLSKIKDPATWSALTPSLLRDPDDEVAKAAWRAAVVLVPEAEQAALAEELATQFGRGTRETQLSLSRALLTLAEAVVNPVLQRAMASTDAQVEAHARATERLLREPDAGSQFAVDQVKRIFAPGQ
jgi:hypothetical protein